MGKKVLIRNGTAAQWTATNPTLAPGELGVETDTKQIKVGNGTTAWVSLGYSTSLNPRAYLPTAAIAQTCARSDATSNALTGLATGRQSFCLIYLPAGTINSITVVSGGTAANTPTNQWFSIYSTARAKLAVTADDTTTAWGTNTAKTLTISGGYTVPTEGLYYLGVMVAAAVVPTIAGFVSGNGNATVASLPPIIAGHDATNTGLTTPATAPATAAALTTNAQASFYAYVS